MIVLKLNVNIYELDGSIVTTIKEGTPLTVGKIMAKILSQQTDGDSIKQEEWARTMYKGEDVIVDKSDFMGIYKIFKESKLIPALTKAAILNQLLTCEKESEKK